MTAATVSFEYQRTYARRRSTTAATQTIKGAQMLRICLCLLSPSVRFAHSTQTQMPRARKIQKKGTYHAG